jgi:uncharacterized radical SAM protein YgiQ
MLLPITGEEVRKRGWGVLDVIFVTGDAYIDHPAFGVPLLARWLEAHGFRVGIISQPDWRSKEAFTVLGRPRLFFAVSAGAMDSMVAHYTPLKKLRRDDAYTPGNRHGARPNRATIVYTSRVREAYRDVPVVIGGIEASLRRFAHYDYWDDAVRRSILFDAKADLLVYGMGEKPILELARRLKLGEQMAGIRDIYGTAFAVREPPADAVELPSFEAVAADKNQYAAAFKLMSREQNPYSGKATFQRHGDRFVVCNSPSQPLSEHEMDAVYALPFAKIPHPSYRESIPAYDQIKASITTHRGCFGGCAFCAITSHQGKVIQSRSKQSVLAEVARLVGHQWFSGSITDLGGPTANMYGTVSVDRTACAGCHRESCLWPSVCRYLAIEDRRIADLLRAASAAAGVKHVAVSSGVRFDLHGQQPLYFKELLAKHVGGLLKVAPEHISDQVLGLMRKPSRIAFEMFLAYFREESRRVGRKQHLVPYLISGHPGCTISDMADLAIFLKKNHLQVEQVQDFTPTPGTLSTCMYYTGIDPFAGKAVHVPVTPKEKRLQKALMLWHVADERKSAIEAMRTAGREDAARELFGERRNAKVSIAPRRKTRTDR